MKLELKHIQHYPIGGENAIRVQFERVRYPISSEIVYLDLEKFSLVFRCPEIYRIKPLLRPMSDLYKERNGKVDIVELAKIACKHFEIEIDNNNLNVNKYDEILLFNRQFEFGFEKNKYFYLYDGEDEAYYEIDQLALFEYLFTNHYDVFGLIEQGLAINKNDIE